MNINTLNKRKLQKSMQQQKIIEMQKRFISSCKADQHLTQYDALSDKYAFNYFTNRPVKKHLKKLVKAINLERLTTKNQKMLTSINGILELYNRNKSQGSLKLQQQNDFKQAQNFTPKIKDMTKDRLKTEISNHKMFACTIFNPYVQTIKPTSIEKLQKLKLQSLRRKKRNLAIQKSMIKQKSAKKSIVVINEQQSGQKQGKKRNQVFQNKIQRIQYLNKTKHSKLVDFINKKKHQIQQNKYKTETLKKNQIL